MVPRGHPLLFSIVLLANCLFTVALAQATAATQTAPTAAPSLAGVNPGNSHYKYVGCYNETTGFEEAGNVRALAGGSMFADDTMTVAKCLNFCGSVQYAGLEYQRECWCAPYLSSLSTQLPKENCNLLCSGNSSESCGGALKLTLYEYQGSGTSKESVSTSVRPLVSAGTSWSFVGAIVLSSLLLR